MKLLEEKIAAECSVFEGDILKVDGFLNHRLDVAFLNEVGKEFARLFAGGGVNKILTVEASGIAVACLAAQHFTPVPPVVFAKKNSPKNIGKDVFSAKVFSFTRGTSTEISVSKLYLSPADKLLIIDDFLAKGSALCALADIADAAGAHIVGAGIVIEKAYQGGGGVLRARGIRVESLAMIESMCPEAGIKFRS